MKCSFFLCFVLIHLSESWTRQEREQRRAQRRKNKKMKQDNKAASLGYNDSNELIHSNKEGQISPFLQYVYGIKTTTKKTTSTTTSTTTKEETTTDETTTEQTTTSAQTTTVPTTTSGVETTTADIRDLTPAERKKRRKAQRLKDKLEREQAYTSRPKTTKKPYNNLSDTLNDVQNIIFSAIWKNKFSSNSFVLPPMPEFPVTTEDPSFGARIILPRIQQDEFNVPNKETLDLIVNFEESNSNRFNRRREFETSALPKCNGEQLQLNLECEGCKVGFPKIDLCARFSREEKIQEESEFKCKIDCGPGFKIADGFNKVKCTKEKWKHLKQDVTEKTCVPIY
ncbi:unnamed protein product [Oikopleura dioica]|uniref:Sushi domain-containing protein n=1 Tax=Oikopleura dioica TaxID=34765 RepID=E4X590_OIKDI|nr:unnamed protein product [Oikopleura dioica]